MTPDGARRNAAFALAGQLVGAAATAAITLVLVRVLDPGGYGVYALALSLGMILLPLTDLGISISASRFIAEHRDEPDSVRAVLRSGLRMKVVVATAVALTLAALAEPIADAYGEPDLVWAIRAMSIAILAQSFYALAAGAYQATGRMSLHLRLVIAESGTEAVTAIGLALLGAGAVGAIAGRGVGYAVAFVLGLALLPRLLGAAGESRGPSGAAPPSWRQIAGYAAPLVAVEIVIVAFGQLGVLLAGAYLGAASAGFFEAPLRLAVFLHQPGLAIATGVGPRLARVRDRVAEAPRVELALRYAVLVQGILVAPLVVWADPIILLVLGEEFAPSGEVLRALSPFIFLSGLAPIVAVAGIYLGEARRRLPIAMITLLLNAGVCIALLPSMGVVGAAVGAGVGYAFYVPAQYWICRRVLGLSLRPLLMTLLRALAAGAAMAGVMYLFGTSSDELPAIDWVAGAILGLAANLLVLIALRELSVIELRAGARWVLRRLRLA